MMMEDHLVVCPVSMSALEALEEADMTPKRCEAAHRRHRSALCVARTAIVSNCDQMRMANDLAGAGVANQQCGYQQKCVVAGNDYMEEMLHFQDCCLRCHLALEWMVGEAEEAEEAGVQLAAWLIMESKSLCQSNRSDVERSQGVLVREV